MYILRQYRLLLIGSKVVLWQKETTKHLFRPDFLLLKQNRNKIGVRGVSFTSGLGVHACCGEEEQC